MEDGKGGGEKLTLVARKFGFGLPTACPTCLPVFIYLRFAEIPFNLEYNPIYPDSDQIPFIEFGGYVAYNNEKGGIIQNLKEEGIADLDSEVRGIPEWVSMRAMVESWLADAVMYELWVKSNGKAARTIYYCDLPWTIGKVLYYKHVHIVKKRLGITCYNAERREEEIYSRATMAYAALSHRLGEQSFFFENRPTSLDALFLGHAIFTVCALPESVLRSKLSDHANLLNYAENLTTQYILTSSSSSYDPQRAPSSSREKPSYCSSKPKSKPKKEETGEGKKFRRRAKYFLTTQLIAVLVFLSILGGHDDSEVELEDKNDGLHSD